MTEHDLDAGRGGGRGLARRTPWTTDADIVCKVRRRWDDGTLLRALARGEEFPVVEVPLRGPKASGIGDDIEAVRAWVSGLTDAARSGERFTLGWADIGGRVIGRNRIPVRASVSTYEQAWSLLGVTRQVRRFRELLTLVDAVPPARDWVVAHPNRALERALPWPELLSAHAWLDSNRGSARYLREICAPGVDTKFTERHRGVLAELLGVGSSAGGFVAGLGLSAKPEFVRVRVAPGIGLPKPLSELAVRADELAALPVRPGSALVVENEITYLSVPVPTDGLVVWGKGFDVDRVGRLPWLADVDVVYWGDLDTHGFAILDRLRAFLPHARSVLMDHATLLQHRDRWGVEPSPARSQLTRLTRAEADLYEDLVSDQYGDRVRLEQERIDWEWALGRLEASTGWQELRR